MNDKIFALLVIFISANLTLGQQKAKEKCREFAGRPIFVARNSRNVVYPNVVGGKKTAVNEFPYMAALGYGDEKKPEWLCGGALISDKFVLTAAHCTNQRQAGSIKLVRLGTRNLQSTSSENYKDIKIVRVIRNPNYKPPSSYNDIALLKLKEAVAFSGNILPACLHITHKINVPSNKLTALGWGKTDFLGPSSDDLLKVDLGIIERNQCNSGYRGESKKKLPNGIKGAMQLCAGGEVQKDTCQGDSGGPLGYKNGRFNYIVGVTSFGKACGLSETPGVYTRVSAYVSWIESVVWP